MSIWRWCTSSKTPCAYMCTCMYEPVQKRDSGYFQCPVAKLILIMQNDVFGIWNGHFIYFMMHPRILFLII